MPSSSQVFSFAGWGLSRSEGSAGGLVSVVTVSFRAACQQPCAATGVLLLMGA